MRRVGFMVAAFACSVSAGCQLPQRTDVPLNDVPVLDTSTVISSQNGLVSEGIGKVPGSICIPDAKGQCDPQNMIPSQCLIK